MTFLHGGVAAAVVVVASVAAAPASRTRFHLRAVDFGAEEADGEPPLPVPRCALTLSLQRPQVYIVLILFIGLFSNFLFYFLIYILYLYFIFFKWTDGPGHL